MAPGQSVWRRPRPCALPSGALLSRYRKEGCHTDCFFTDLPMVALQDAPEGGIIDWVTDSVYLFIHNLMADE